MAQRQSVRIAAVADLHCSRHAQGAFQPLFAYVAEQADVLLLCGDLIDYGQPEEAQLLVKELGTVKLPILAVMGNHEYESEQSEQVAKIFCDAGVVVLDGDAYEVHGVGFAGVKGFGGGFGRAALQPWGEPTIKRFVHDAVEEALKLESALAKLRTPQRIALLHYSPLKTTVEGEPPEIYAFLGSSRLEEPLNRYPVAAVFHGHAHHGTPEGCTSTGIPVYNVAYPLLRRTFRGHPPVRILELPLPAPTEAYPGGAASLGPVNRAEGANGSDGDDDLTPAGAASAVHTVDRRAPPS
jgi:Icc-related predicted phosphoesterase